ncbi:putative quinol monooxygenase [Phaeobacter marinintestinus]|uniref:putative quinol monooxygenase n=1 Tax=Falsiphaeobacter marinintestinus TaxID=1492905 RepID=UPI0011B37538|nr:putative quinol monooxygenase [Phaeobacter marinintestinus]
MYVVCVTFDINPDDIADFMPLMLENAHNSLTLEPDCHQFDVCRDPDRPDTVFLYELYTDRAAFDAHLNSAHFRSFDAKAAPMIAGKVVATYTREAPLSDK